MNRSRNSSFSNQAAVREAAAAASVYSGHEEAHVSSNVPGQTGKTLQPHPKKANRNLGTWKNCLSHNYKLENSWLVNKPQFYIISIWVLNMTQNATELIYSEMKMKSETFHVTKQIRKVEQFVFRSVLLTCSLGICSGRCWASHIQLCCCTSAGWNHNPANTQQPADYWSSGCNFKSQTDSLLLSFTSHIQHVTPSHIQTAFCESTSLWKQFQQKLLIIRIHGSDTLWDYWHILQQLSQFW